MVVDCFLSHLLLKMVGNEAFMLRMLVATDAVGDAYFCVCVGFQRGFSSSPSTGLTRSILLAGSGTYSGNLSIVPSGPFGPGFDGLKGLSCSALLISLLTSGL